MLNTATPGQRIVTDSGTAWNIYQDTKHDDSDGNSYAYNPGASPSSFSLTTARLQGNTAPAGSGTTLGTLNISSLAQRATGSGSLYRPSTSPTSTYLIETDPRFASYRQWLSSDYMLKALALDPATTQKRLGDGFYEQRLLTEQVAQLTGRRFLAGYQNEEDQYRALMTAGITFAKEWQLIPGVALTPEQMARLTTDMVWLVEKEVTLADGSKQKALVPQLYARVREGDLLPAGGLLADRTLDLNVSGNLTNLGTLAGRQLVSLTAENLQNLGGRITGEDIWLTARQDLQNPGGTLKLAAAGDIKLLAAQLQSAGTTDIQAGNNLTLGTVTTAYANSVGNGKNSRQESGSREVGTTIASKGNLTLQASNNLTARASDVTSTEGKLLATAGNDLRIEAGESTLNVAEQHKTTSKGFLSKKTTTTRDTLNDIDAVASTLSGDSVTLIANRDIGVKGSNVVATNDTTAIATRNLIIEAATETHNETHVSKTKQSGAFSSGTGFTIGSKQQSTNQKTDATRVAKSTVGSTDGNVLLLAGETYKQVGSDVVALKGNIDIAAKQVDIVEARETSRTVTEQKSKQSGLTLAVSSPVITAVQTAQQMSQAAADTKDGRMKALAAANVGLAASNAVDAVQGGQGPPLNDKPNQIQTGTNPDGSAITRDANAADQMGGINISLSIGSSKSSSKTTQTSNTAVASNLTAGRDISIEASGAGKDSDITLQGAKATAARNLTLAAEDEIRLLAAANTADQHSTNKNSSASLGVGFALGGQQNGFTIQAGVSGGKGKANGNDVTWSNTQVEAGNQLTLESGGDTTLKGATAKGEQVRAQIGGNLTIESLQDTSTYDSRQKSLGASVSLCIPPFCYGAASSGSISASASKIKSDYASVTEQSAIKAGDGGFQVDVKGDTGLKAGAITSTQKALDEKLNSFKTGGELTLSDIQNKADYSAKSASVNIGTGFSPTGALIPQGTSAGFGKDSGSASSTTQAAISGIAGNTAARTGDAETGIQKIFDQQKVQKEIDAQTQITQIFGQSAPKAAADFAKAQADDLKKQGNFDEAAKWEEGGVYRVALHTALGGLAGGTSGAFGAAAGATAAPFLNELQASIAKSLQDAGANDGAAKLVGQLISGATAAGIGAAVGSTQGATTAFNTDSNNRQLHPNQVKAIKDKAIELAGKDGLDAQQWEQRLTQQLLYQNDSTQASFGNDLVAESILKQVARSTGVDLDARGTSAYGNHAMNSQFLGLLASSYQMAGTPSRMSIDPVVRAMSQAAQDPNMVRQTPAERKQLFDNMLALTTLLPPESLTSTATTDKSQSALFTALNQVGNSLLGTGYLSAQEEEAVRQRQMQALVMGYGNAMAAAGLGSRALQGAKALAAGADVATIVKIENLAQEAIAANAKLPRATSVADGPYNAPAHTSMEPFQTHGVTLEQVPGAVRNQLAQDLAGGAGVGKLEEIVQSGKSIPIPSIATSDTKLYRIQVEGRDFNSQSVYYMDAAQLQRVRSNPQLLQDMLGLPPGSSSAAYTIYERQPLAGQTPTVYQSNISTVTTDIGGKSVGAGVQTIVPNSKLWSEPKVVGTVRIKE